MEQIKLENAPSTKRKFKVIVGENSVGKTHLLNRIFNSQINHDGLVHIKNMSSNNIHKIFIGDSLKRNFESFSNFGDNADLFLKKWKIINDEPIMIEYPKTLKSMVENLNNSNIEQYIFREIKNGFSRIKYGDFYRYRAPMSYKEIFKCPIIGYIVNEISSAFKEIEEGFAYKINGDKITKEHILPVRGSKEYVYRIVDKTLDFDNFIEGMYFIWEKWCGLSEDELTAREVVDLLDKILYNMKELPYSKQISIRENRVHINWMLHHLYRKEPQKELSNDKNNIFVLDNLRTKGVVSVNFKYSTGQLRLMEMFSYINNNIFPDKHNLIIIDEVDLHLHPIWQREVITMLDNFLPKNKISYILSTHNTIMLSGLVKHQILIGRKKGEFKTADFPTFGKSSDYLLSKVYKVKHAWSSNFDKAYNEYIENIKQKMKGYQDAKNNEKY